MCCTLRFHEMYVISLPPGAVAPPGGAAPCSSACAVAAAASQGARAASAWCACMAVCARSCPGMRCGRAAAGCAHPRMAANSAAGAAAGAAACAVRCCLSCPLHLQRRVQGRRAGLGQVPDAQVAVCCASGQQVGAEAVELQALDLRGSSVHAGEGGEALVGASLQPRLAHASPHHAPRPCASSSWPAAAGPCWTGWRSGPTGTRSHLPGPQQSGPSAPCMAPVRGVLSSQQAVRPGRRCDAEARMARTPVRSCRRRRGRAAAPDPWRPGCQRAACPHLWEAGLSLQPRAPCHPVEALGGLDRCQQRGRVAGVREVQGEELRVVCRAAVSGSAAAVQLRARAAPAFPAAPPRARSWC